jgi:hypothetical protein
MTSIKIILSILIPNNEYNIKEKVDSELSKFNPISENYEEICYYELTLNNEIITDFFEGFLDYLRQDYEDLRYIIKIYEPSKKYPRSVRINKQFKKVKTKQQTKFIGF